MAIVVLVLWLFTAGAGFYLLATSNLRGARSAATVPAAEPATASVASAAQAASSPGQAASGPAQAASSPAAASPSAQPASTPDRPATRRQGRAARDRFAPPSLVAARNAPVLPGMRSLLEFAHPACAIIGLGFWLGYTFVHYRPLGWIAFGLVTATIGLGLSWFTTNTRAARRHHQDERHHHDERHHQDERHCHDERQRRAWPSFSTRLIALHGGGAAVTFALAALTALVLGG